MSANEVKVSEAIERGLNDLSEIVQQPPFQAVIDEMYSLPAELRHEFVDIVLMDTDMLTARKIVLPEGVSLQRSYFTDNRPTLFCISKYIQTPSQWQKVTITFDNPIPGAFTEEVSALGIGMHTHSSSVASAT